MLFRSRTLSAIALSSGVSRSSFDMLTISAGPSELDEMRDRNAAFDLRLKCSERNLAAYLVRGPLIPLWSTSPNPSNSSASTLSANAAARTSTPAELASASETEKMDWKREASCLVQWARVLSVAGVDAVLEEGRGGAGTAGLR